MYSTCYTFTCPQAGGTKLPHPKSRHFEQLLKLFEQFGTPDKRRYLFLGGYVDNGPRSLDTICLLFLYKAISGQFLGDDLRGSWRRPQSWCCLRGLFTCSHGPTIQLLLFDSVVRLPGSSASWMPLWQRHLRDCCLAIPFSKSLFILRIS